MSTKLVILGLLRNNSLHGYELKSIIEQRMGDWTNIAFGSIYFALKKLKEEGLVEVITEEKIGNRPSRSVYKITENGNKEFTRLLTDAWQKNTRQYYELDIAVAFIDRIDKREAEKLINERISNVEHALDNLKIHKKDVQAGVPKIAISIFSHTEYHLSAELNWLKELVSSLKTE